MIDPAASALLTALYELTMLQAYHDRGMNGTAVFEFFSRKLPRERNFLVTAGLEQVLEYLCGSRIPQADDAGHCHRLSGAEVRLIVVKADAVRARIMNR